MSQEVLDLDLTGFLPQLVNIRMSPTDVLTVSTDQPPALLARANEWLMQHADALSDTSKSVDVEVGWDLAAQFCGRDMHSIGVVALVRLLHFFRKGASDKMGEIYSLLPSESQELSTEESPSESSSEVRGS